jgi:hypothetical protein
VRFNTKRPDPPSRRFISQPERYGASGSGATTGVGVGSWTGTVVSVATRLSTIALTNKIVMIVHMIRSRRLAAS